MKPACCPDCNGGSRWKCWHQLVATGVNVMMRTTGILVDWIKGPSTTIVYDGKSQSSVEHLRPDVSAEGIDLELQARQIVFHTRYQRRWIPDMKHAVYEVVGTVNEDKRHLFDPKLFETVTYPMLCNRLLSFTRYPYFYAMLAHLNRVYPKEHPFRQAYRPARTEQFF